MDQNILGGKPRNSSTKCEQRVLTHSKYLYFFFGARGKTKYTLTHRTHSKITFSLQIP